MYQIWNVQTRNYSWDIELKIGSCGQSLFLHCGDVVALFPAPSVRSTLLRCLWDSFIYVFTDSRNIYAHVFRSIHGYKSIWKWHCKLLQAKCVRFFKKVIQNWVWNVPKKGSKWPKKTTTSCQIVHCALQSFSQNFTCKKVSNTKNKRVEWNGNRLLPSVAEALASPLSFSSRLCFEQFLKCTDRKTAHHFGLFWKKYNTFNTEKLLLILHILTEL